MNNDNLVVLAFGLTNALRLASYAPQIWRVARDDAGAQAISCLTWNLWTLTNLATALYAWSQWRDAPLTAVNLANALCCAAVVVITGIKRAALRKRLHPSLAVKEPSMKFDFFHCTHCRAPLAVGAVVTVAIAAMVLTRPDAERAAFAASAVAASRSASTAMPALRVFALDAGVDWNRIEPAPEHPAAAVAAYER